MLVMPEYRGATIGSVINFFFLNPCMVTSTMLKTGARGSEASLSKTVSNTVQRTQHVAVPRPSVKRRKRLQRPDAHSGVGFRFEPAYDVASPPSTDSHWVRNREADESASDGDRRPISIRHLGREPFAPPTRSASPVSAPRPRTSSAGLYGA